MSKRPTSWRCKDTQQQKDKNEIYQSREWAEMRKMKMEANPWCEMCLAEHRYVSACLVHHIHPIEESTSKAEMRKWAFMWSNLQSLCRAHHAEVHSDVGYHTKAAVQRRAEQRHERWKDSILQRFCPPQPDAEV